MGIIQKDKIKMKWNGANRKNFEARGYVFTHAGDEFEITVDDLHDRSHVPVLCRCDFCGNEFMRPFFKVVNQEKIACLACKGKLTAYNLEKIYGKGINNIAKVPEIKAKIAKNNLEKYGSENVWGSQQIKDKIKQTNLEKYGVENVLMAGSEIRNQVEQTNLERYGSENPFGSKIIQEKIKETNLEKRGVLYATQSKEVQQKMLETFIEHGHTRASKEQKHYANLFNGILDYPFCARLLDIAFIDKKIYVECDFGGHFAYAKISGFSELDVLFNDAKRDIEILSQNWKCIRYLNRGNKFPTDYDIFFLNLRLMKILQTTNVNRILVDLNNRIVRLEPRFVFKSLDMFL